MSQKTKTNNANNFVTCSEFKKMIRSISPNESSVIIGKYIKNKIIFNNDKCYIVNDYIVYENTKNSENQLLNIVSTLLFESYNHLQTDEKDDLKEIKGYDRIFKNSNIKEYIPQLVKELTKNNFKFDSYFSKIHFKNGYKDLETKQFHKRILGKDFITACISYDYNESLEKTRDELLLKLAKIYPKKSVLTAVLTIIGSALTGLAIRDSYLLFLLGRASAGKSTILDLTKYTVECYVKQVKPDMFMDGKNTDKIVNTYDKCIFIRITWINEPKDKKFDSTFIKSWCDGECNAEKLYAEGSHDFKHFSITVFTANNMPNINVDGGVTRRIRSYEHQSKFIDNKKEVNEKENVFLSDKDFKTNFDNSIEMKLAFFDIIAEYAFEWLKTKKIHLPEEFTEAKSNIIDSNDHIQDFIDGYLTTTNNQDDRIGKNEMLKLFSEINQGKHLTILQMITLLKEKGLKYDRQLRVDGIQGCFYNIKLKRDEDNEDYDNGISKKDMSVKITIDEQIEHYTKLLNDLSQQKIKEIDDFVVKTKVTKNNKKQLVEPEPVSESESEDEIKEEKPTSVVTTAALKVKKLFEGF